MEPLTAVLAIGGAHGVAVLVRALGGGGDLASLSSEVFRALTESESRIDARLGEIESQLDEVLEQPYVVALADGVRHFLDAGLGAGDRRAELDRARDRFITASSAARSELQRAVAERYILLCLLASTRFDLVAASLERMEAAATAAAIDAAWIDAVVGTYQWKAAARALGRSPERSRSRDQDEPAAVRAAAQESLGLAGRLLGEAALLAPEIGLPPRVVPPSRVSAARQTIPALSRRVDDQAIIYRLAANAPWIFTAQPDETLRIGSLSVTFPSGPADTLRSTHDQPVRHGLDRQPARVARVDLRERLTRPLSVLAAESGPDPDRFRPSLSTFGAAPTPRPPVKTATLTFGAFAGTEVGPEPGSFLVPMPAELPAVIGIRAPPARPEIIIVSCLTETAGLP